VKVAKAPAATKTATITKTASAKSVAKPHKKPAVHQAMAIHPAGEQSKDQSKVETAVHGKAQKPAGKNAAAKGKKVKVADAEARK
jgi:hypothetical protein